MVSLLQNSGLVDEIWILPSGERQDKPNATDLKHRFKMAELAFAEFKESLLPVSVSDLHCGKKEVGTATIDLLDYCKATFSEREFFVVIGSELVTQLSKWKEPRRLQNEAKFLVIQRLGAASEALDPSYHLSEIPNPGNFGVSVSSTSLRAELSRNAAVHGLISEEVVSYIKTNKWYG